MRGVVVRLLDRGWDARWVMAQPLYRLTGMISAVLEHDRQMIQQRGSGDTGSGKTFRLSPEAMVLLKEKRDQQRAERNKTKEG